MLNTGPTGVEGVENNNAFKKNIPVEAYEYRYPSNFKAVTVENKPTGGIRGHRLANLKEKQAHFQKANGIPIHLKGGPADKRLFGLTVGLVSLGLIEMSRFLVSKAFPSN